MPDAPGHPRPDTVVAVYVETDQARADSTRPTVGGEWEIHTDDTVTHLKPVQPGDEGNTDPTTGPTSKPVGPRRSPSVLSAEAIRNNPQHYARMT